jgi:hypothetical protein
MSVAVKDLWYFVDMKKSLLHYESKCLLRDVNVSFPQRRLTAIMGLV